jgi:hypothetical protein
MNIIINGFHHPKQIDAISNIINYYKVNYLLHICDPSYTYVSDGNVIVENLPFDTAGNGDYAFEDYEPLDEELIEKMAIYEPVVLKMMDRLEYYSKKDYPFHERRLLYHKHLRYWNNILRTRKIDLYIGTNIPHEVYDYVIYGLAKIYNIPTYFFLQSQINNLIHPMTDWEENCKSIVNEFTMIKTNKDYSDFDFIVKKEWEMQTTNVSPFYMKKVTLFERIHKILTLKNLKKAIHPYYYKNHFIKDIIRKIKNDQLKRHYNKISITPDFNSKYIYLALHYQPEMTTCPIGGAFVDQYLIVDLLDKYLPENINIFIKEHPKQEIPGRYLNFYEDILRNRKRVFFVNLNTSTFDLIKYSLAVATVSGTVGWEALFRQKSVLLFGHNFYQYAPGVFPIKTKDDCIRAINSIINGNAFFDSMELKLFIQATSNCSIKGIIDTAYEKVSDISIEESNDNIFNWLKENVKVEK